MRTIIPINNDWLFCDTYLPGMEKQYPEEQFEKVNLPHNAVEIPYNYFDDRIFQKKVCYWHKLTLKDDYKQRSIFIDFEGVMAQSHVYLNGNFAGKHKGGYTPFTVQIDHLYDWSSKENYICVVADSSEDKEIPPFGGQIDYLTYSGIYREVAVRICDRLYIKNIKIECENALAETPCLKIKILMDGLLKGKSDSIFELIITDKKNKTIYTDKFQIQLGPKSSEYLIVTTGIKGMQVWDLDNPVLYTACIYFTSNNFKDSYTARFGIREALFTPEGFFLNQKKIKLIGLNRHSSFPYTGPAMPKRVHEHDAEILKKELHLNIVRTSHYPQSPHFLNRCDELGLLVFEEIPGWQHIGDEKWKSIAKQNVHEMIERDWNHPSIILWGVRINESADDNKFYTETNQIAHELDSTRQTGGVRCIKNSHLIEDVYTYNDFKHNGDNAPLHQQQKVTGLSQNVPYLVTEYCGHMYPTKKFDQEERVTEHVLRHLRILNQMYGDNSMAGSIGWCAFDYNTHKDFGSGDKICYHGIMDMFRLPKFASAAYKSQVSPEKEIVLEPVTYWSRGERSIGGIFPLVILTNCDYVELHIKYNKIKSKILPDHNLFPFLPHPPAVLTAEAVNADQWGAWGNHWNEGEFIGYIKGKPVIKRKFTASPTPCSLTVVSDHSKLSADRKDATRIIVRILDQHGNRLWFLNEIIKIEIDGPAKIIGPHELVTICGETAFWIESKNIPGKIIVKIFNRILGQKTEEIIIV